MNRYAISCLPLLVLASLTGCAVDGEEDDVASDEEAITASCDLGSSCPSSIQLLQARSYQNRPPANLRGDLEIVSDQQGWDKTPRRFSQKTSRPMKYATGRVLLAGNAAGDAEVGVDDFFLFEALDLQGQRIAAATLNAGEGVVKLDGQPVRALERDPVSAGWKTFAGGTVNIASLLPKDQPFRLRVSAMDFAGSASATDLFISVKPSAPLPPVGGRACTTDAECGGGAAMCFIDQCKRVEDSTKTIWGFEGIATAFSTTNQLRIAYKQYAAGVNGANGTHTTTFGTWSGDTIFNSGTWGSAFSLDRAPGREPMMASVNTGGLSDSFRIGEDGGPSLPGSPQRVKTFGVARNNAGTTFLAYALYNARGDSSECALFFSKHPAGGTWSAAEKVGSCGWTGPSKIVVHVRKDGNADIVTTNRGLSLMMYKRQNPIDPWKLSVILNSNHDQVVAVHGIDGTTHLVAQDWKSLPSYGDFDSKYIELGDEGIVRDIPLPVVRDESAAPYTSIDVDSLGNAWIVKRALRHQRPPTLVRIDPAGNLAERAIGTHVPGPWHSASVAVSSRGEIAFAHAADSYQTAVGLRRLIPVY